MSNSIIKSASSSRGRPAETNPFAVVPNVSSEASRFIFPTITDGIADHIKNHDEGTIFQGAAIADRDEFNAGHVAKEMKEVANKKTHSTTVTLEDIELSLVGNKISLSMADYVARFVKGSPHKVKGAISGAFKEGYDYLCIRKVFIYFVPLQSALNDKFESSISLEDYTKSEQNRKIATVTFDSNIPTSTFMSMDYYIPFENLGKLKLTISCNQSAILPGYKWGAIRVRITALQNTFPKAHNVFPTQVQTYPPLTLLAPHFRDPKVFNARLLQEDLEALKSMLLTNEIGFLGETADEANIKQKTRYANSRFASGEVGNKESIGSGGMVTDAERSMLDADSRRINAMRQQALENERKRRLEEDAKINEPDVVQQQNLIGPKGRRFSVGEESGAGASEMEEVVQDSKLLQKTGLVLEAMMNAGMDPEYVDAYMDGNKMAFTRQFSKDGIILPARMPMMNVPESTGMSSVVVRDKGKGKAQVAFSADVEDNEDKPASPEFARKRGSEAKRSGSKLSSYFEND